MMKGIWFDDIHSYKDLNLVLSKPEIPPAAPKTNFIDIPGGDGSADVTEAIGGVKFKDRKCKFTFAVFPQDDYEEKKTQISNLLNGRRCRITLDKDPDYYYLGRCSIDQYASNKNLHSIVVGATVAPYKFKKEETSVFIPFCGKNLLHLPAPKTTTSQGVTWEITEDGRLLGNGTPTAYTTLVLYSYADGFILGKGTYTLSFSGTCENILVDVAMRKPDGTQVNVVSSKALPFTFTMPETSSVYFAVKRQTNNVPLNMDCCLQVEQGSQATDFEAYTPTNEAFDVTLLNGRKPVVPTVVCTGETTMMVNGATYNLNAGTHKILDFQLTQGETPVTLSGTGVVSITYREGDL